MGWITEMVKEFLKSEFGKDIQEIRKELEETKRKIDEIYEILKEEK